MAVGQDVLYGVQAVMFYAGNCACEADWFCDKCPFAKTLCDKDSVNQEDSFALSDAAEKFLKDNGIADPWEWRPEIPEEGE